MQNQKMKRNKKEVFVYERGVELITMLGELTEDQLAVAALEVNDEKTIQLREVMDMIIEEVKEEFAPNGIKDEEMLNFINSTIKNVFVEIVSNFDFNYPFCGCYGEFAISLAIARKLIAEERDMIEQEIINEDFVKELMEYEEDFCC